jgi:phage anti-repressor protein
MGGLRRDTSSPALLLCLLPTLYQISSELRILLDQTDRSQEPVAVDMNGEHTHGFDLAKHIDILHREGKSSSIAQFVSLGSTFPVLTFGLLKEYLWS